MSSHNPSCFIFIALPCEAKPLIDAWQLKKLSQHPAFALYADHHRAITVTGIGKSAMAGAVTYTMATLAQTENPLLLNIGIAGHPNLPLGSLHLANKITDSETDKSYYPQIPKQWTTRSQGLTTWPKPQSIYAENRLCDMEASGFYEMSVKFSTLERIHCLKIISDNRHAPIDNIHPELVGNLIARHLPLIEQFIDQLQHVCRSAATTDEQSKNDYQAIIESKRLSVSNQIKLKALLKRWYLLTNGEQLPWQDIQSKDGRVLLSWLEQQLAGREFYL